MSQHSPVHSSLGSQLWEGTIRPVIFTTHWKDLNSHSNSGNNNELVFGHLLERDESIGVEVLEILH